ncbi:vesicle coat component [Yamadazyma tenuis]|uniref:GOLD domain-containing protein n=1 Tax=Candida tenuis (strain ATCC 10573 / BCRC 21748 / CBS 615 / JCM 9827 / NBRC 10315 / NRRL Y-1498 / VKM Y-70) TaxID=590646 RepID=G3B777_CANTC|nr:uncharacterized protein CANTEDRAFT_115046 [Yamadazyma tenuis ATCC 10573]XP_006688748.1 uncharacterized protein CANTEDRAFT_115046 [Yamadazyma tenuis ATCC 10573]EGV62577.1 hypothetical protein CANTEDRAFT_115046 [Yamadazyma tenuis ATCC 10573]EGV62578.1 hypothetical protein CANTEDRAFT_115046 [Yamadazyma tenuis ATCC 10573]WEJ92808.1 vesicle coat component [Yamadazyma tenuis]
MKSSSMLLVIATLFTFITALNVDILAKANPEPVCIRDFVGENQLVVINIKTNGRIGDGQQLNVVVTDSLGNELRKKNDIGTSARITFTSFHSAAFDVCFTNVLETKVKYSHLSREVELDIESGAAARDWNAIQVAEKLKPNEVELRRVEEMTAEIASELQYLKKREERMRDTNESTNSRVKYFSTLVVISLVGLGAWQIQYLRHYFKVKHII